MNKPQINASQEEMINVDIEDAKLAIARYEALLRLFDNKDFEEVILKDYIEHESTRLTMALADPNPALNRNNLLEQLLAISNFNQYLITVQRTGYEMKQRMDEFLKTRDEIIEEGE